MTHTLRALAQPYQFGLSERDIAPSTTAMSTSNSDLCGDLANPSIPNFVLSLLLTVGMIISYAPQHARIINRRSARGFSQLFLFLGLISSTSALTNILLLSRGTFACITSGELTAGQGFAASLGVVQVALQYAMFVIMFVLCEIYSHSGVGASAADARAAIAVSLTCALHAAVSFFNALVVLVAGNEDAIIGYASFLGTLSTLLAAWQYAPQILTTYRLGRAESLSIHTLLMQVPGGFLWAFTLAIRPGTQWSTWLPYFVAAALQTVLLSMCIIYEIRRKRLHLTTDINSAHYHHHDVVFYDETASEQVAEGDIDPRTGLPAAREVELEVESSLVNVS
ncbi:uncharacterized protein V1518DRAFT_415659 [Limtongia smithiae]|uniref:uncharacterized protein n=1 Tax=Limtongia smithiae TaxID=1125753 RepID=UPI0034CD1C82